MKTAVKRINVNITTGPKTAKGEGDSDGETDEERCID